MGNSGRFKKDIFISLSSFKSKEKAMTQKPNDQRSVVMNPNNVQHTQNQINRINQLNPNHKPTKPKQGGRP